MNKLIRLFMAGLLLLTVTGYMTACTTGNAAPPISSLTETEVRILADPIAENIFQAMNSGNYTAYTRDFSERLKKNLSENTFQKANGDRIKTVGTYVSKEYWRMSQNNDKLNVAFQAKFTDEPAGVLLTLFFKNIDGKRYVDGFYYDSPLMRKSDC